MKMRNLTSYKPHLELKRPRRPSLQSSCNCNRCGCGWNAHQASLDYFFPPILSRINSPRSFICSPNPLFRVRNKKKTLYCYDDTEREAAIKTLGRNPEITRFKGLGEISPDEFKHFIADDIRLDPVKIDVQESIKEMLKFFMGKNTPERQEYIIRNLAL